MRQGVTTWIKHSAAYLRAGYRGEEMEHATKCMNRSRVALSSIFYPLESPEMQSSLSQRQWDAQGQEGRPSATFVFSIPLLTYQHEGTGNVPLCLWLWCFPMQKCLGCGKVFPGECNSWRQWLCVTPRGAGVSLGSGGRADQQGFTLWDPLIDLSCYCGWRKALRLGWAPGTAARAVKAPRCWKAAVSRGCQKQPHCLHRTICDQLLGPLLPYAFPGMCVCSHGCTAQVRA